MFDVRFGGLMRACPRSRLPPCHVYSPSFVAAGTSLGRRRGPDDSPQVAPEATAPSRVAHPLHCVRRAASRRRPKSEKIVHRAPRLLYPFLDPGAGRRHSGVSTSLPLPLQIRPLRSGVVLGRLPLSCDVHHERCRRAWRVKSKAVGVRAPDGFPSPGASGVMSASPRFPCPPRRFSGR